MATVTNNVTGEVIDVGDLDPVSAMSYASNMEAYRRGLDPKRMNPSIMANLLSTAVDAPELPTPEPRMQNVNGGAVVGLGLKGTELVLNQQAEANRLAQQEYRVAQQQRQEAIAQQQRQALAQQELQQRAVSDAQRHKETLDYHDMLLKNAEKEQSLADRRMKLDEKKASMPKVDPVGTRGSYMMVDPATGIPTYTESEADKKYNAAVLVHQQRMASGGGGASAQQGFYEVPGPNGERTGQYRQKGSTALYSWDGKGFVPMGRGGGSGSRSGGGGGDLVSDSLYNSAWDYATKVIPSETGDTVADAAVKHQQRKVIAADYINASVARNQPYEAPLPDMPDNLGIPSGRVSLRNDAEGLVYQDPSSTPTPVPQTAPAFKDGDTKTIQGVVYKRINGTWTKQ